MAEEMGQRLAVPAVFYEPVVPTRWQVRQGGSCSLPTAQNSWRPAKKRGLERQEEVIYRASLCKATKLGEKGQHR